MFCTKCGSEISPGAAFCVKCGQPVNTSPSDVGQAGRPNNTQPSPPPTVNALPWGGAVMLQSGESVTYYWSADHEIGQLAIVNGRRQTVKQRYKGYLVLTTHRMIFVKERGVFGKSYHIDMSFPFDSLAGMSMGGLVMKYVSISDMNGEQIFHVHGVGNETEFAGFRSQIQDLVTKRQQAIEDEKRRDRIQITMDFGSLKDYMAKGGLSVQVVKCPQCGAPISFPKEGSQTVCEHCGSTIFAQDIMEKVKQLIG